MRVQLLGFGAALLVACGAGFAAGAVVIADQVTPSPLSGDVEVAPLVVQVGVQERTDAVVVGVSEVLRPGREVRTTASGTVTQVHVVEGDEVVSGQPVVAVDDRTVVAMEAGAPLFRDLEAGSSGDDVRRLEEFLAGIGLFEGTPDAKFGDETGVAVRALNDANGWGAAGSRFDLGSVAWIGPGPTVVGEVVARVGDAGASVLFRTPERTIAIAVSHSGGSTALPEGDVVLEVGDVSVPYVPGSGRIDDPDSVAAVVAELAGAGQGAGRVRLTEPRRVKSVPATAVITDSDGTVCVLPDVGMAPVVITPIGGGIGTVDLDPDTDLNSVLANPTDVLDEYACD